MQRSTSGSSISYSMGAPSSSMAAVRTSLTASRASSRRDLAARRSGKVVVVDNLTGVTRMPEVQEAEAAREAKVAEEERVARVGSPSDLAR